MRSTMEVMETHIHFSKVICRSVDVHCHCSFVTNHLPFTNHYYYFSGYGAPMNRIHL